MPDPTLRALAARTGSYTAATSGQLQSRELEDRNASARFLEQFQHDPRGLQQAFGEAINDVRHPVTGRPVSFAQLQAEARTNNRGITESAAYKQGNYRTVNDFLQDQFNQGRKRLEQRAVAEPTRNMFEPAAEAVSRARMEQAMAGAQTPAYDPNDPRATTAAFQQRMYQVSRNGQQSVAPGMSLRTQPASPQAALLVPVAQRAVAARR